MDNNCIYCKFPKQKVTSITKTAYVYCKGRDQILFTLQENCKQFKEKGKENV